MTPREADKAIKSGQPVTVTSPLDPAPYSITIVRRDRWNVYTSNGGVFDRGDLVIVQIEVSE